MQFWTWPKTTSVGGVKDVFTKSRNDSNRKAHTVKMQASEIISLIPVLTFFLQTVVFPRATDADKAAILALVALADVLDFLQAAPHGCLNSNKLTQAIERFLALFRDAFGVKRMHPKYHMLLHLPQCLARLGFFTVSYTHLTLPTKRIV